MANPLKSPKLVGNYIRQRREALGLSQRALGLLFTPPVTTQFISNIERGVTPLPPAHVPTLTKALVMSDSELMTLLEKEYTLKLSGRLGRAEVRNGAEANGHLNGANGHLNGNGLDLHSNQILVTTHDHDFMRSLYEAYKHADTNTKKAFATLCENMFNLPKTLKTEIEPAKPISSGDSSGSAQSGTHS